MDANLGGTRMHQPQLDILVITDLHYINRGDPPPSFPDPKRHDQATGNICIRFPALREKVEIQLGVLLHRETLRFEGGNELPTVSDT